jgi:hypothetical protein
MNEKCNRALTIPSLALLVLLAAGCQKDLPPLTDPDVAREALAAALDAWKEGRSPETLLARTPPIDFSDIRRDAGSRLTQYRIADEERSGLSVRFTVRMTLQQKNGASRERTVVFNVDAGKAVVIRPDF